MLPRNVVTQSYLTMGYPFGSMYAKYNAVNEHTLMSEGSIK
jgi:hypothetical protein